MRKRCRHTKTATSKKAKMFTERYVRLPVIIYDYEQTETMGKSMFDVDHFTSFRKVNPFGIEDYGPTVPPGFSINASNAKWTVVYTRTGNFIVPISCDEFEEILNKFYKTA